MKLGGVDDTQGSERCNASYGVRCNPLSHFPMGALAAPVSLGDLFAGGSILQGDKFFDSFSFVSSVNAPDLPNVLVEGITTSGNYGLRFSLLADQDPAEVSSGEFTYRITTMNPTLAIHGTSGLISTIPSGTGTLTIGSTMFADASHTVTLGSLSLSLLSPADQSTLASDGSEAFALTSEGAPEIRTV